MLQIGKKYRLKKEDNHTVVTVAGVYKDKIWVVEEFSEDDQFVFNSNLLTPLPENAKEWAQALAYLSGLPYDKANQVLGYIKNGLLPIPDDCK